MPQPNSSRPVALRALTFGSWIAHSFVDLLTKPGPDSQKPWLTKGTAAGCHELLENVQQVAIERLNAPMMQPDPLMDFSTGELLDELQRRSETAILQGGASDSDASEPNKSSRSSGKRTRKSANGSAHRRERS